MKKYSLSAELQVLQYFWETLGIAHYSEACSYEGVS